MPLTPEAAARVAGSVRYKEPSAEDDDGVVGSLIFWGWQTGAALLAGMLAVALSRRVVQNLVSAITRETTLGGLLGFGAFLIVPVGAVVVMMTVVGLPIGTIAVRLGGLLWLAATWLGLGAMVLSGRRHLSEKEG